MIGRVAMRIGHGEPEITVRMRANACAPVLMSPSGVIETIVRSQSRDPPSLRSVA